MLQSLYIQNVVLIDELHLSFQERLCLFTGETGAGKSMLLDALGLALGERAQTSVLRPGSKQAISCATFNGPFSNSVIEILAALGFETQGDIVLRRVVSSDGKSRAFLNDQPVSLGLLRQLATELIEIHGQFDQLLTPSAHLDILDQYALLSDQVQATTNAFQALKTAEETLNKAKQALAQNQGQVDFLREALAEFKEVSPQIGEEQTLLEQRQFMAHRQKIVEAIQTTLSNLTGVKGIQDLLAQSERQLGKVTNLVGGKIDDVTKTLERVRLDLTEAETTLVHFLQSQEETGYSLEHIDERLYRLRTLARKHGCLVETLPALWDRFEEEYKLLEHGDQGLQGVEKAYEKAQAQFIQLAENLSSARHQAAGELEKQVEIELKPLKLERVRFQVHFEGLSPQAWSPLGIDSVEFRVQTNPGHLYGGIGKIASGGERSRLMLALKVVLCHAKRSSIIVFDEIDNAVGGAVAAAIGERLARLAQGQQVLAITHSPQLAAYAQEHYVVAKQMEKGYMRTVVTRLTQEERRNEIARMLSANQVTQEARAAADSLLKVANL